jgi:hypothetical protein
MQFPMATVKKNALYIYSYEEKLQLKFEIHKIIMVNYTYVFNLL